MKTFSDAVGLATLAIAREAIARALTLEHAPTIAPLRELDEPAATFVTLKCAGELRGCIGSLRVRRTLREDVAHNACAAAFEDPRFTRLTAREYAALAVEVSLLSPMERVDAGSFAAACAILRPGVDGVLLESGERRATFLPQVWDDVPDARAFLKLLQRKAGLPPGGWSAQTRLSRYTVMKWREP
jgi:AmmeMemoRadiSam system protein A